MSRWFRFYDDAMNDPKVLLLPSDTLRWQWVVMLCIASQHKGKIPSLDVVALALRMKHNKAAQVIAALNRCGMLDADPDGYFQPHNWSGRQYESDVSTKRVQEFRKRKKERECNVSETLYETDQIQKQKQIDDDGDARARASLISPEANRLADEVTKIAGHDLKFVPPSWCGAAYRAQQWINHGWPEDLILLSVREQAAKKRDGPARSIQYFEPGIASAIAKANQPLPKVVEIQGKTVEVSNAKPAGNSATAVAKRREREFLEASGLDSEPYQPSYLRLPAR